jgi:hypothetical protein
MMSVDQLRDLLGHPELSDRQVADIRDTLYAFADTFIGLYLNGRKADRRSRRDNAL